MLKKVNKPVFVIGLIFALSSCGGDDSSDNNAPLPDNVDNSSYTFTLVNRTAGFLADVKVDTRECGDMEPDESCETVYNIKPSIILVFIKADTNMGEVTNTETMPFSPGAQNSETINLNLKSAYFSLWVKNETSGYAVEALRLNLNGTVYEKAWNLSYSITNDGLRYWMGFFDRSSTTDIDFWDLSHNTHWDFNATAIPQTADEYGTYSTTLICKP